MMGKPIVIWMVGNNGMRNPNRIMDGFRVFSESPFVGHLRKENEIEFTKLLNEKGIIHNEEGKDESGSHARKWRLVFSRSGLIYPKLNSSEGQQSDLGPLDDITPFGRAFLKADTYPAIQEFFLRAMSVEQVAVNKGTSHFSPLRWILAIMVELEKRTGTSELSRIEFAEGVARVINFDLTGCNAKLSAKQSEITDALRDMNYQIEIVYCHTGNQGMNEYASRALNSLLNQVNEDDSTELLTFTEIKLQDIYEYLANGQINESIVLNDVLISNWGSVDAPFKAYYGTIQVSAVGEWYNQYGNQLFAKNIRYYKGSTEVNQGIKEVLKTQPEKFFYYNNGIKLLCKKITKKLPYSTGNNVGLFALEGVSLVNGAQTTGVIGAVCLENPELIESAKVFVQMIDLGDAENDQAVQITKLSNTQNRIDSKDFVALDPQQDRLRMELNLAGIQYLYKSGSKLDDPVHQISLDEAIVSQAYTLDDLSIVALVKRNIGALTENIDRPPYKLLFNGATNSFAMYNGVQVLRSVDFYIKQNEPTETGRKRLVLIHGNRFLLHLLLQKVKIIDGYDTTYLDNAVIDEIVQTNFNELWNNIFSVMQAKYPEAYPAHIFKNVGRLKELVTLL